MTKKIEPNILDKLFNITVSDREVKQMLIARAETMPAACLGVGDETQKPLSERAARRKIAADLAAWMYSRGLTGRGTKRLVDKVTARAMKGYGPKLRRLLHREAKEAEEGLNQREADAINARLASGQAGARGDVPAWWYRQGEWRGERLAAEFRQKNR